MNHPPLSPNSVPEIDSDPTIERYRRRQQAALGYRIMASWGWGADGSGHITARDPLQNDCFWLLRYGVPFGEATVDDLVLVDPSGSVVDGSGEINRAAYFIHHPIHAARPDVIAAVHMHTPYGTPFSARVAPLPMSSQEACPFVDRQGVFDGVELNVTDLDTGHRLAACLGQGSLLWLANHGPLTVARTVAGAVGLFLLAERAAEVAVKVPDGRAIADAEARNVATSMDPDTTGWHVFEFLVRSRLGDRSQAG
jgi:ribulose-5-phosphate 4-epimerase/fuculose-1-phosphate aldolase